jgi:hypothetical protein
MRDSSAGRATADEVEAVMVDGESLHRCEVAEGSSE